MAEHSKPVWTQDKVDFLLKNKDMMRKDLWLLFCETFPEHGTTFFGFNTKRSEIGAVSLPSRNPTVGVPVGSEQIKKGYIRVKVAQPNVWKFKHWLAYEQATGETVTPGKEIVLFLDLDNRNFAPENLVKLTRSLIARINSGKFGYLEKGNPEKNAMIIAQARLEKLIFDRGEQLGEVSKNKTVNSRRFKSVVNRKSKEYRDNYSPEKKEELKQKAMQKYREIKADPVRYREYLDKRNAYLKEYNARKRQEKK